MILNTETDIDEVTQRRRLVYFDVVRIGHDRFPHVLQHGRVSGLGPQGRPRKKWLDNIRVDCAVLELYSPDADRQETRESGSLLCAIHEPTPRRGYVVVVWTLYSLNLQRTNQLLPNKDLTYLTYYPGDEDDVENSVLPLSPVPGKTMLE